MLPCGKLFIIMIYTGKKLHWLPPHKNTLVMRDDGFLVTPFYKSYKSPFNWGYDVKGFATIHLALSIIADFYNVSAGDTEFAKNMESTVMQFANDFVSGFDDEWELDSDEICDWIESMFDLTGLDTEPEKDNIEDNRDITFSVAYQVEPAV
jgi:Family of unknown function (DUF6166)